MYLTDVSHSGTCLIDMFHSGTCLTDVSQSETYLTQGCLSLSGKGSGDLQTVMSEIIQCTQNRNVVKDKKNRRTGERQSQAWYIGH